jgi:hypothetical protein
MGSLHFQYEGAEGYCRDQLHQGDILERTRDLERVLEDLYPYAHRNPQKYSFFVVLTQSCDLVAEGQRYRKAEHITICAARPISFFLDQEISKLQTPPQKQAGICLKSAKQGFFQKIERLLSNEEYPYFYLHPAETTPFTEGLVAYLRVTFPLRTDLHYDACLAAKRVQLAPEFRAKLGWLTTLVFGRVATKDFLPDERHKHAKGYIDGIPAISWLSDKALKHEAKQRTPGSALSSLTPGQLRQLVEAIVVKSQPEKVVDLIVRHARTILPSCDEDLLEKFRRLLLADNDLVTLIGE